VTTTVELAPQDSSPTKRIRVLSVDDVDANHEALRAVLEAEGYDFTPVAGGSEAMHLVQKATTPFDVIILSVMRPSVSGYDFCRFLRDDMQFSNEALPVIMISTESNPSDKFGLESLRSGAHDFIVRPLNEEDIRRRVRAALTMQQEYALRSESRARRAVLSASLPSMLAERMLAGEPLTYEVPMLSVLSCTVADWSSLSTVLAPSQLLQAVDALHAAYDKLAGGNADIFKYRVRSAGFVAVAGLEGGTSHAETLAELGMDILQAMRQVTLPNGQPLRIKVVLLSGPAWIGVVGCRLPRTVLLGETKACFDALQDISATSGCVHLSSTSLGLLPPHFVQNAGARLLDDRTVNFPPYGDVHLHFLVPMDEPAPVLEHAQKALAPAAASAHGGASGSTFAAMEPVHSTRSPREAEQDPSTALAGMRLLSVDDDEVNQEVIQGIFKPEGFNLAIAMNGAECLEQIEAQKFDILLLDSMMPGMSGLEVCKALRKKFSPLQLPIIMLTCRIAAEEAAEAINMGCNDYVRKPFTRVELVSRVRMQLAIKQERQALSRRFHELVAEQSGRGGQKQEEEPSRLQLQDKQQHHHQQQQRHKQQQQQKQQSQQLQVPSPPQQRRNLGAWALSAAQASASSSSRPAPVAALPPPGSVAMCLHGPRPPATGSIGHAVLGVVEMRSDNLYEELGQATAALREQERTTRSLRAELAASHAKISASDAEIEELWQRLLEAERMLQDGRRAQCKLEDVQACQRLGLPV